MFSYFAPKHNLCFEEKKINKMILLKIFSFTPSTTLEQGRASYNVFQ